ncbi:hypothetical protein OEZ86_009277 [Tetradesmus obliquus]|nr:hypothetical protein OEZ86_009277 [Tetradesmus obliquus]
MDAAVQEAKDQAEQNELLIWAAARGLLADAVELIARGAEPQVRDKQGLVPAHYAAAHGHLDLLQYLATKGADLEAEDPQGRMPLHHAVVSGSIEVLRFLIQRSTWLDAADGADDTALHLAARRGWAPGIKLLLAGAASPNIPNKRGLSALGEAVAGGHTAAAEVLLQAGADTNCRAAGYTLLHIAAGMGHKDFAGLNAAEQGRKVDTFARMSEQELGQLDFLSAEARQAISQVRRAQQLLTCYRAVAALRIDESFQEDASEPAVQAALHEMALANSFEQYKGERHIMAVAAKLKKFHSVMQECGMRLGLQDVLVKPGQTLAQLMEQDAQQVQDAELDLDLQLQQAQAAAAAEAAAAARSRGLKPLEEMSFWERMRYEVLNSFKQAVKIMCMVFVLWGVMWCFGLMPYQQDPLLLEQRMQQMAQARQQQQQQQGVAAGGGHTEL